MVRRYLILAGLLLTCRAQAQAQVGSLEMVCTVKEDGLPLDSAVVIVYQDGAQLLSERTDKKGRAVFKLPYQHDYRIEFTKDKYVTKFIEVSAKLPKEEAELGSSFKFDIRLFPYYEGLKMDQLKQPVAQLKFDGGFGDFYYDMTYHKSIKDALKEVEEHALALKNQEERKLEMLYNQAITEAEKSMAVQDYDNARDKFKKAITIKIQEPYPKMKLAEVEKLIREIEEKKKKYEAVIAKGDNYFTSEQYKDALNSYTQASELLPGEEYPKTKIKEIERILAAMGEEEKAQKAYEAAIRKADGAFAAEKYDIAQAGYTEALGIRPNEPYPKDRLAEIEKRLKDQAEAEQQKKNQAYTDAIARGDKAFGAQDYEEAKKAYQAALDVKPGEQYPKDKISEINSLLAEQQARFDAQDKINQSYLAAVTKGDKALAAKEYEQARTAYEEARTVKPEEKYPPSKLAEIERLLKELDAQKAGELEREARYKELLAKADVLFQSGTYLDSRAAYQEAGNLKPYENYPKEKIREIEKILADAKAKEEADRLAKEKAVHDAARKLEEEYRNTVVQADRAYGAKDYEQARALYQKALDIKPSEEHPKNQLRKMDEQAAKAGDRIKDVEKQIAAKYSHLGEGLHKLDKIEERNRTTETWVLIRGHTATEYQKIVWGFGQTLYYKNGQQISQSIWDVEVKQ